MIWVIFVPSDHLLKLYYDTFSNSLKEEKFDVFKKNLSKFRPVVIKAYKGIMMRSF